MTNYYKILGLTSSATAAEIKAAFRSLAKIYHPDKNPGGQEDFKRILLAYETLSDPKRKYAYDLRLKYQERSPNPKTQTKKTWTFEEKEMRRRQYYNEHIKKYEKKNRAREQHSELKKSYNEYKYILFATPIAVLLFLMVVKFANPDKTTDRNKIETSEDAPVQPNPGDSPYASYFGGHIYDSLSPVTLKVKNLTGKDVVVNIFTAEKFVRGCYIKNAYTAEMSQLPENINALRYGSGSDWDYGLELKDVNILGGFRKLPEFYEAKLANPAKMNDITLTATASGFEKISSKEFFRK